MRVNYNITITKFAFTIMQSTSVPLYNNIFYGLIQCSAYTGRLPVIGGARPNHHSAYFTSTQPTFTTTSRVKAAKCLTTTHIILGGTLLLCGIGLDTWNATVLLISYTCSDQYWVPQSTFVIHTVDCMIKYSKRQPILNSYQ